jgi:LPPG:FO 2-phospho-L-lactate transferase
MREGSVVALAGGIGAARFLDGLVHVVSPSRVTIIGNTGDDAEIHGLHISPDLDTVSYTLAGLSDPVRGWGIRGDAFRCLESLGALGAETWFQLGDRDLATHIYRTDQLRSGIKLSEITGRIASALGIRCAILPMSNESVRTRVQISSGEIDFQTYFVKRRARDKVIRIRFDGASKSSPAPGVMNAIERAEAIIICPSNPFISIGPILSVPGIREAIAKRRNCVVAISPIIGGRAIKGPAARMMKSFGLRANSIEIAKLYEDFASVLVIDESDRREAAQIERLGFRALVTRTMMKGPRERKRLAQVVAREMGIKP